MTTSLTFSSLLSSSTTTYLLSPKTKTLSSTFTFPHKLNRLHHPKPLRFSSSPKISASISVGDKLPYSTFSFLDSTGEVQIIHAPRNTRFVEKSDELKEKVDTITCISAKGVHYESVEGDLKVNDEVLLLSDGNGDFTKANGVELDLSDKPVELGVRSRRYALLAEDGVVKP